MVRPEVFTQKLAKASFRLKNAEELFAQKKSQFLEHEQKRDLATFYLFLAIQECLDIAAHWVADYGCGPSQSAGYAFDVLAEKNLISLELAGQMRLAAGLRNRIAHGYSTVDHERLYEEFRSGAKRPS